MSVPEEHRAQAPTTLRLAVLTVSDTRTPDTDESGQLISTLASADGFAVADRRIVPDEPEAIRAALAAWRDGGEVDAVIVTGGTGVAPRDRTPEAVAPLLTCDLPGFGELFRMLSFQEVGPAAMLSRAAAGLMGGVPVFLLPGSKAAVYLACERLVLPELPHLVGLARGRRGGVASGGG